MGVSVYGSRQTIPTEGEIKIILIHLFSYKYKININIKFLFFLSFGDQKHRRCMDYASILE